MVDRVECTESARGMGAEAAVDVEALGSAWGCLELSSSERGETAARVAETMGADWRRPRKRENLRFLSEVLGWPAGENAWVDMVVASGRHRYILFL